MRPVRRTVKSEASSPAGRRPGRPANQNRPAGRKNPSPADTAEGPALGAAPQAAPAPEARGQVTGVLELHAKGFGFLRQAHRNFLAQDGDPYVGNHLIDRHRLKAGQMLTGPVEPAPKGGGVRLAGLDLIEGQPVGAFQARDFDRLTAIDPHDWLQLETKGGPLTTRVMDLLTPVGRGQRGLIVAPPRSGKTYLIQHVAQAVAVNYPGLHLMMLLVDERPEEVTDMKRAVKGEVFASSNDRDVAEHIRLAETVLERAKRLVEAGKDVFLLLDSLTRLARAYNKEVGTSGRTMTGGIDIRALDVPKRLFGQARAFEEGGSLTVLGTCLIETGSKMDEIIFQEFKGTGNMELVLDRRLAERRVFPAMEISQSGTRKEERLLPPDNFKKVTLLRRSLAGLNPITAMESLAQKLADFPGNDAFLERIGAYAR
jgi:transcription termination factor Rho